MAVLDRTKMHNVLFQCKATWLGENQGDPYVEVAKSRFERHLRTDY